MDARRREMLTAMQASRYLKLARTTFYNQVRCGEIPAFKLGREWRFIRSELDRWVRRSATE